MYSIALTNVLMQLEGGGTFPAGWTRRKTKVDATGSIAAWFKEVVDDSLNGAPERIRIESWANGAPCDLGVLAVAKREGNVLSFAGIEAIVVVGGELESLYLGEKVDARYHRLDYHPDELGKLLCEPLPHVHLRPDGPPRLAIGVGLNPVTDFFDMIYRNYFPEQWLEWARDSWREACRRQGFDDNLQVLETASTRGKWKVLTGKYAEDLGRLRAILQARRDNHLTRLRVDPSTAGLLGDVLHHPLMNTQ